MKRLWYLTHHWLGIIMCLFMAMWFFSGVVMMYVQYPALSNHERLAALPALNAQHIAHKPDALLQALPDNSHVAIRLSTVLNRPAYIAKASSGDYFVQFADTGKLLETITADQALTSARAFAKQLGIEATNAQHQALLSQDQWSISSRLHRYRPLHKVALNDIKATELYVSAVTGTVVLDTTGHERVWNWLGANLHWLYPKVLRQHGKLWYWLVVILACLGLASIISGAVVGYWRLRIKKRYKKKHISPYKGQLKLHHILGLCFLLPVTTYTYSGLMSMGAFGVPAEKTSFSQQLRQYQGETRVAAFQQQWPGLEALRQQLANHPETREIVWYWIDSQVNHYFLNQSGQRLLFQGPTASDIEQHARQQLEEIVTSGRLTKAEKLTSYNRYYYAHHHAPILPVLRMQFDDADNSWFYIHPQTGELLERQTTHSRTMRWLYHGLHRLDFPWLINHRPAWDITVIFLSLLGFVFSVSAVIIAWRYLRNPQKRRIKFLQPLFSKTFKSLRGHL